MPRKPIDYSNTIIYKIFCNDSNITDVYVGQTTDFTCRKNAHKQSCNEHSKNSDCYLYKFIRDNGGWENWSMIELEHVICINRHDAAKHEKRWIEKLNATLNKQLPTDYGNKYILQNITCQIQLLRPTISKSSTEQHARTIHKIYTNLWPDLKIFISEKLIETPTEILLSAIPPNRGPETSKNYAAALGIFTSRPELSNVVTKANEAYRTKVNSHVPSEKDIANQLTPDDITRIDHNLHEEYLTGTYNGIKRYVLWSLISGKYIPPRRLLDWTAMKVHHIDESVDNYIDHSTQQFVFNQYKTHHIYGQDRIHIPDPLYKLLAEYISMNEYDYLFHTGNGKQMAQSNFTSLINTLSKSKSGHSINAYRKAYLQKNFSNLLDLDKTMRAMGSSKNVINSYVKAL